jgi:thiol-disulfide isomerase/thioredoxin
VTAITHGIGRLVPVLPLYRIRGRGSVPSRGEGRIPVVSAVGAAVVVAVLVLATLYAALRRHRAGTLREPGPAPRTVTPGDLGQPLGDRATLVQFSSAFCRPCVTTRHVLGAAAAAVPGVAHVDIDAESHLDLVRRLGIAATPTTVLVDARGVERRRAQGVPRRDQVLAALHTVVD